MRRYSFYYDDLSRLSEARYTDTVAENTGRYNTSYSYDKHGNLQSLRRNGMQDGGAYGIVDDLYYEYDGNRLCKVRNAAESPCYKGSMHFSDGADEDTEYSYDSDGNLIEDKNKDITCIEYNVLNLPKHVDFKSGKNIDFIYSATGDKLYSSYLLDFPTLHAPALNSLSSDIFAPGKFPPEWSDPVGPSLKDSLNLRDSLITDYGYFLIYGAHRIDYCGDILYEDVKPTPNRILFDGGYVTFTNNKQPVYHFYLRDHQGNVRVVADENGTVEETNHYYPFGALFGECAENNKQRYKYNGKELDRLLSLDWYDYGARWYDPVLARWHAVDPLADKYPDVSPYVYCNNNAVNAVD
ncbi:RHS repeat domain-containing protein, partial [Xylanibacter caecicola]